MTAPSSIAIATFLYIVFHYYLYQLTLENSTVKYRKSNIVSTLIYLCGVLLLIYRFDRQLWKSHSAPVRIVFDVMCIFITLEVLINFTWERIEYIALTTLPNIVNIVLQSYGASFQVGEVLFVPILYIISLTFLIYAHNSDKYLDYFLDDEEKENSDLDLGSSGLNELVFNHRQGHGDMNLTSKSRETNAPHRGTNIQSTSPLRRSNRHRKPTHL